MNLDLDLLVKKVAEETASQLAPLLRPQPQQWMTLKEAAKYLRCNESTLGEMARRGDVPAGKLGGTWRFSRQELDSTLKA